MSNFKKVVSNQIKKKSDKRKEFISKLYTNKSDVYSPIVYANVEKYLLEKYGSAGKVLDMVEDFIFPRDKYCNSYYQAGNLWAENKIKQNKDIKQMRFMMGAFDLILRDENDNYVVTDEEVRKFYANIVGHIVNKLAQDLKRELKQELALKTTEDMRKQALAAGLSRIVHHANNGLICCITAFRGERDLATNRKNNSKLENDIRSLGYGFIRLGGGYKEEGKDKPTPEESFCIIDNNLKNAKTEQEMLDASKMFLDEMLTLGRKYEQDSILIRYYLGNGKYKLAWVNQTGDSTKEFSPDVSLNTVQDYWSQIHNKKFLFKEADCQYENGGYSGFMKAMARDLFMQDAKKNNFWY